MPNLKVENEIANVQLGNFSTYLIQFLDATLEKKDVSCTINCKQMSQVMEDVGFKIKSNVLHKTSNYQGTSNIGHCKKNKKLLRKFEAELGEKLRKLSLT